MPERILCVAIFSMGAAFEWCCWAGIFDWCQGMWAGRRKSSTCATAGTGCSTTTWRQRAPAASAARPLPTISGTTSKYRTHTEIKQADQDTSCDKASRMRSTRSKQAIKTTRHSPACSTMAVKIVPTARAGRGQQRCQQCCHCGRGGAAWASLHPPQALAPAPRLLPVGPQAKQPVK